LVHARLKIGAENSGKLVAQVKNEARRLAQEMEKEYILVDGAPGIGCPVTSSLAGANFAVLVTEPTVSGFHDLKRVSELLKIFSIRAGCIINKCDLNLKITSQIEDFLQQDKIIHISSLPYDDTFTRVMINGQTVMESGQNNLTEMLIKSWEKIKKITATEGKER
jgi:MinD superfamily P-loop ATPase